MPGPSDNVVPVVRDSGQRAWENPSRGVDAAPDRYKWAVLVNTTVGMLMVTIDGSIVLIALPRIFRGIGLDPLVPANSFYLLWMILGFLVATSVLVVSFGRMGDMYGRVKIYNLGFALFTFFSLLLSITWMSGTPGAMWLVALRVFQGVAGAMIMANSAAIVTDAFPANQRGIALGINTMAATSGTFIGLVLGGLLAPINWRLIFIVNVPIGLFCTAWAYTKLRDVVPARRASIDWAGNLTFALGLIGLMVGISYGIEPYGGHSMGWTNPVVDAELAAGVAMLAAFVLVERRCAEPMFRLSLFRIRAFTAGIVANFLTMVSQGGLQFMLIIWLQGIWLPLHGYDFASTPLWAGIFILPATLGTVVASPLAGLLTDRFGARLFATAGVLAAAVGFLLFQLLPVNFSYWQLAPLLLIMGLSTGFFFPPNRTAMMNSLPIEDRGAGSGMIMTFQNSAKVLSNGIFFSLMIIGLSAVLPDAISHGLVQQGVSSGVATRVAKLPPVSTLFAAFLGFNPMGHLLGQSALAQLPAGRAAVLQGNSFFPNVIAAPFRHGLRLAFSFSFVSCLVAAAVSWSRGTRYAHIDVVDEAAVLEG
jgi:EmrB/QacA subfamily drug resistance transporter